VIVISIDTTQVKIKLKIVFYIEAAINFVTVFLCLFFPAFFISQLTDTSIGPVAVELARWYGVLLFVITFIMLGILIIESSKSFFIVMLGYLLGDFAQIAVAIYFAVTISGWSVGILVTLILTLILVIFRFIVIFKPQYLGFKDSEKKDELEE
jgi:hypothetical protein